MHWWKRHSINAWIFSWTKIFRRKSESWIDLSNYTSKADLKNATGVDTSKFAKRVNLANLICDVHKLDNDELKNVPCTLRNLKSKAGKLDVDRFAPIRVDLSRQSDVVKNGVIKEDAYNVKIEISEDKIPNITTLATNTTLNAKTNEIKGEIPSITNFNTAIALNDKMNEVKNKIPNITNIATTTALTAVENKIPNVSNFVKNPDYNRKLS